MERNVEESAVQEFVRQAQGGRVDAFGMLYDVFVDRVYRFVFLRVGHKETAEDLTAAIFLKAWEHVGKYKYNPKAKFSTWLFTIAHRTLIDYYRKEKRAPLALEQASPRAMPLSKNPAENLEDAAMLDWALEELRPDQRSVLMLHFREGFSLKEIAEMIGKSQIRVRAMKHRALKKLRSIFSSLRGAY